MSMSAQSGIEIRRLNSHAELDAAVTLQREVWGYQDLEVDSRTILTVASRFAGQTLGAFRGGELVGFSLAFAGLPVGHLHSHRVGVHPSYQNLGVGRMLKLAQREDALARGIDVIQWTFDPLQRRNAYFNLVKLGGISNTYIPNLYGITTSPLHGGLPTDRLLIEWHLESDRVQRILAGERLQPGNDVREVKMPAASELGDPGAQTLLREEFQMHFRDGYSASGLRQESESNIYLLERL